MKSFWIMFNLPTTSKSTSLFNRELWVSAKAVQLFGLDNVCRYYFWELFYSGSNSCSSCFGGHSMRISGSCYPPRRMIYNCPLGLLSNHMQEKHIITPFMCFICTWRLFTWWGLPSDTLLLLPSFNCRTFNETPISRRLE